MSVINKTNIQLFAVIPLNAFTPNENLVMPVAMAVSGPEIAGDEKFETRRSDSRGLGLWEGGSKCCKLPSEVLGDAPTKIEFGAF